MSSGMEWNEEVPYDNPLNSEIQMDTSSDPVGFVLSRRIISEPGKIWNYNGGTTELLAAVLEKVSGKKIDEFAKAHLFNPMGIETIEWTKFPGTSTPAAASGLRLRSRDLLKFGILYHHKGRWNNQQIIPANWTTVSLQALISRPGNRGGYGYLFWTFKDSIQHKPIFWAAAVGNGDQRIYFDEKNNLIVVTTAGNYNLWTIKNDSYAILKRIYDSFSAK
jgi:CubicO group peptidase (beta-lactamase class C family)